MQLHAHEVPASIKNAFPDYTGRKFSIEKATEVQLTGNYWSGGYKTEYRGVDLATGQVTLPGHHEYGNPFTQPQVPTVQLVPGKVIVANNMPNRGIVIYVHPDNVVGLLPAPTTLTADERIVLENTAGLKSSYAGISNYRFHEANRKTGITLARWEAAKQSCINRKLLTKAGAITVEGRNAI